MTRVVVPTAGPVGRAVERAVRALGPEWHAVAVGSPAEAHRAMSGSAALVDAWSTAESVDLVRAALAEGVPVVSANAAAVAHAGAELHELGRARGGALLADAACGGSLVRRVVAEMAETEGVASIQGCLDPVAELLLAELASGRTAEEAAAQATGAGVGAEALRRSAAGERAADVLTVLAGLAFRRPTRRADVAVLGVDWLRPEDAARAAGEQRRWRLVATATSVCARVEPMALAADHPLADPGCRLDVLGNAGSRVRLRFDAASPSAIAAAVTADLVLLTEESCTTLHESSVRSRRGGYSVA